METASRNVGHGWPDGFGGEQRMVERRAVEHRAAVPPRRRQHVFGEVGIDDERRRARAQVEHDRHGEMVRHRQNPHDAVRRADAQAAVGGGDALEQAFVRDDNALARARRAGTEADERGVQRGKGAFVETGIVRERDLAQRARTRRRSRRRRFRGGCARVRAAASSLASGTRHLPGAHDGQREDDVRDAVRAIQRDARGRHGGERSGGGLGAFDQLAVGDLLAVADQRDGAPVGGGENFSTMFIAANASRAARTAAASSAAMNGSQRGGKSRRLAGGQTGADHPQGRLRLVAARQAPARHEKRVVVPRPQAAQRHAAGILARSGNAASGRCVFSRSSIGHAENATASSNCRAASMSAVSIR